ncbi:MAG: TetR/AcrR family transcriptional regulator [Solirubrobacterales bacterium]
MTATGGPEEASAAPLYQSLRSGPRLGDPDLVAAHQRQRIEAAMVEAVWRHGYRGTTVREVVEMAGVSKTTFYECFESREDCFWATFRTATAEVSELVLDAFRSAKGREARLRVALETYARLAAERPKAASLAVVEALCLGEPSVPHRAWARAPFERTIREFFDAAPGRGEVSEVTVRAAVAGFRSIAYRALRVRRLEKVGEQVEELLGWLCSYQLREGHVLPTSVFRAAARLADDPPDPPGPDWGEPPDSPLSRRALTQRERIMRAVAREAAASGYANLSVPTITAAAGVSNQTFYQEFEGKPAAFLAAFEALSRRALGRVEAAFLAQTDWYQGVGAGITALLAVIAADRLFARLAFFELPVLGAAGLDRADATMDRLLAVLGPELRPKETSGVAPAATAAIAGGVWSLIQTEIEEGRASSLPELAPEITDFVLEPFLDQRDGAVPPCATNNSCTSSSSSRGSSEARSSSR